jgi:DNA polymerase II small subunit/DNA polymerase delta subunit B
VNEMAMIVKKREEEKMIIAGRNVDDIINMIRKLEKLEKSIDEVPTESIDKAMKNLLKYRDIIEELHYEETMRIIELAEKASKTSSVEKKRSAFKEIVGSLKDMLSKLKESRAIETITTAIEVFKLIVEILQLI